MKKMRYVLWFFAVMLFISMQLSGCRSRTVSADPISTEASKITLAETTVEPLQTEESSAAETEAGASVPVISETDTEVPDTQAPEVLETAMMPPAQVQITFSGTPNRYDYITCSVSVTDPSGKYTAIQAPSSQIKVRGHSTSAGEKAPYNIKLNEKTDLLGLGRSKKWNLLANLYDRTQLRNMLALNLARDIGLENTSQTCYAEVYVNGEYRGLYQICEPIDVGSDALDLDIEGNEFLMELEPYSGYKSYYCMTTPHLGLLLGLNEPEMPTGTQWNWLVNFMSAAETALLSEDWQKVQRYFDVESFARCYIVQELFKNVDYNVSSTRFYIKNGKLHEGPVWDFDLSAGNCSPYSYPDYNNVRSSGLSYRELYCIGLYNAHLFKYEEFRALVAELYRELQPTIVNLYRDNEIGKNQIDVYLDNYREEIDRNASLWSPQEVYSDLEQKPVDGTYDAEIDYLRHWLEQRNLWLYAEYCE